MSKTTFYWKIYKEYKYNHWFYVLMLVSIFVVLFTPFLLIENKDFALMVFVVLFLIFMWAVPNIKDVENYLTKKIIEEELNA